MTCPEVMKCPMSHAWGPHANLKMNENSESTRPRADRDQSGGMVQSEALRRDYATRKGLSSKFGHNGAFVHSCFVQVFCEDLCSSSLQEALGCGWEQKSLTLPLEMYDLAGETLIRYSRRHRTIDCDKRRRETYRDWK